MAAVASCAFGAAQALTVTLGGTDYDIGTLTGTFDDLSAPLQSQVFWGDYDLAEDFSQTVGAQLGLVQRDGGSDVGPFFAVKAASGQFLARTYVGPSPTAINLTAPNTGEVFTFATATPAAVPLPASALLLLAGGLGLALVRQPRTSYGGASPADPLQTAPALFIRARVDNAEQPRDSMSRAGTSGPLCFIGQLYPRPAETTARPEKTLPRTGDRKG